MTLAVTGVGAITALGASADATWDRLLRGERAFRDVTLFPADGYRVRLVAEVPDAPLHAPDDHATSRTGALARIAVMEAMKQAAIDPRLARVGLVVGGTTAGMLETESLLASLLSGDGIVDEASRSIALTRMLTHPLSAPTDQLDNELGPFARVRSLSSACSSGANALAVGATWIELGLVDIAVCGAADALCRVTLSGFNALGALDPEGSRPFDRRRRGLTLGEGAGFVVLETVDHARARGQGVVCTLLGWAARSEAHHITNPEPEGEAPVRAMRAALARAGLSPADVDYVNAHGTGTQLNDAMESRAIHRVWGGAGSAISARPPAVPVSSVKGQIGHTLAAAGAIEAVVTALAISRGALPPAGGLEEPDPACAVTSPSSVGPGAKVDVALSSSFGFGGMDAVLVFGSAEKLAPPRPPRREVVITGAALVTPAGIAEAPDAAELLNRPLAESKALRIVEPEGELDPERSRRLDRASRLATIACARALGLGNSARGPRADRADIGLVLGSAFGAVDSTSAFMRRLRDKGARLTSPADFPSLVPSSPAGHVSIYLGLGGPVFVVADLADSSEDAFAQAFELIAAGDADRMVAGAVEETSAIVDSVLGVVFAPHGATHEAPPRHEGAGAIALAADDVARARQLPRLARVVEVRAWTDAPRSLEGIAGPSEGSMIVLGRSLHALDIALGESPWRDAPHVSCAAACGSHEAAGAGAITLAASMVARGEAPSVLFAGMARGRGYAGVLARCD